MKKKHIFVILAYKESKYLENCIVSVLDQGSDVVIATSTPNTFIEKIANKYNLEIVKNPETGKGIAFDFEFALSCGNDAQFLTIAHQDDFYDKGYAKLVMEEIQDDTLIAFADYFEMKEDVSEEKNINLKIKRILLFPLRFKAFQGSNFIKRACLAFGNPISCPSVTFNMAKIAKTRPLFVSNFNSNMDWYAWEKLSREEGKFVYINKPLMSHRIHEESTTSSIINDGKRTNEDLEMFKKFWPLPIAKIISKMYRLSERNNR